MFRSGLRLPLIAFAMAAVVLCQDDLARLYSEAQQAQAAGELASATQKYEAIVRLRPRMAEAYANLGNVYYQQGQTDRAKSAYQKAIQLKPDLAGPHFFLGVIAFGVHDYAAALRYLQRAAALQTSNALTHSYLGYTHYARAEYREAAGALEKASALEPTDIDVLYHLSKSYGHLAQLSSFDLQTQFPNSVYAILARAHVAESKEEWKEAREQYALALDKMPGNERLREKLRWTEAKAAGAASEPGGPNDDLIDASLVYRYSPPSGPKLATEMVQWREKLRALQKSEKRDQSVYLTTETYQALSYLCLVAVLEADPDSYRAHQLRAQLLEESNDDDGAIEEYRKVLKRKPDLQNIHFAIGSLHWKNQRFDQARPELLEELRLNPHHPQALYELGDILAFAGDMENAEKYLLQAVRLEPAMAEAYFALEKIYTQSGRYEKSLERLRKTSEIDPSDPTPHYRRALIYRKMGKARDAETELALFNQKQAALKKPAPKR